MARGAGILERTGDLLSGLANRLQAVNFGNPGIVNFGRKKDDDDKQTATQLGSTLSEDRWSKLIDLLQDMNRGIWSLVGHSGADAMMPALPNNAQAPSAAKEDKGPSILEKLDGLLTNFAARQSHAIRNPNSVQGIGQSIGSAGNLAGGLIGMIPGGQGLGAIISGLSQFGEALVNSVSQLQQWAGSLHQANIRFAEFSPEMAGVKARQDLREWQLGRVRGSRRAETAEQTAESYNRLNTALGGIEDTWENGKGQLLAVITEVIAPTLEIISNEVVEIGKLVGINSKTNQVGTDFGTSIDEFLGTKNYDDETGGEGKSLIMESLGQTPEQWGMTY